MSDKIAIVNLSDGADDVVIVNVGRRVTSTHDEPVHLGRGEVHIIESGDLSIRTRLQEQNEDQEILGTPVIVVSDPGEELYTHAQLVEATTKVEEKADKKIKSLEKKVTALEKAVEKAKAK